MNFTIVDYILKDHSKVKKMFSEYSKKWKKMKEIRKNKLLNDLIKLIEIHSQAEEKVLYKNYENILGIQGKYIKRDSKNEHLKVKKLIKKLSNKNKNKNQIINREYILNQLVLILSKHIKKEEEIYLKEVKKYVDKNILIYLGKEYKKAKQNLEH